MTEQSASVLKPGDLFAGKYRIQKMIGKGGMGAVYVAQHELLFQQVAIKVLLPEIVGLGEAVARFLNEARAAARIQSEHVARVLDVGTENGAPYMVMEYLEGEDLAQHIEQWGPMAPQDAVDCVLEALEAVASAHSMQIVHRDLKPANLFLTRRAHGARLVKVLDFGISKAQSPLGPGSGGMTSTKAMLGSPFYMSPEQLRSSKSVDARTDIWSTGVILFELLTGTVPYGGDNIGELFAAILEQAPPHVRSRRPEVPQELDDIVMKCLQRNVDQRYQTSRELAIDLARLASGRGRPRPEWRSRAACRGWRSRRRSPRWRSRRPSRSRRRSGRRRVAHSRRRSRSRRRSGRGRVARSRGPSRSRRHSGRRRVARRSGRRRARRPPRRWGSRRWARGRQRRGVRRAGPAPAGADEASSWPRGSARSRSWRSASSASSWSGATRRRPTRRRRRAPRRRRLRSSPPSRARPCLAIRTRRRRPRSAPSPRRATCSMPAAPARPRAGRTPAAPSLLRR